MKQAFVRLIRRFLKAKAGVAAVEFALMCPIFLGVLAYGSNFGFAFKAKLDLTSALAAGVQYAYGNGSALQQSTFAAYSNNIAAVISKLANLENPVKVTVLYNNDASGALIGKWFCLSGATYTPSSAGASCPGNTTAGQFVTISASSYSKPLFSTSGDNLVNAVFPLNDTITVQVLP